MDVVLMRRDEGVCTVTMNRPGIMNAFNEPMLRGLQEAFDRIARDEEVRVVVLEGAQGHFSSGADMSLLHEGHGAPESLGMLKGLGRLILGMRELPQPILCKVRGVAYGVGANLALAGDLVLASDDARFCEVFVNIGVILDGGGTYFLPRLVGLAKAREIALLGQEMDGKTAASIGLIHRSVPDRELDGQVDSLARAISRRPPAAVSLIKEGLEGSFQMSLRAALEWEAAHQAVVLQSREHKEAVQTFLASRGKRI